MILAPNCCTVALASGYGILVARPIADVVGVMRERQGDGWVTLPMIVLPSGTGDGVQVLPRTTRRRLIVAVGPAWWRDAEQAMDAAVEIRTVATVDPDLFGLPC